MQTLLVELQNAPVDKPAQEDDVPHLQMPFSHISPLTLQVTVAHASEIENFES